MLYQLFEAGSISYRAPAVNTTGQQNLNFGFGNVNGKRYVDNALESNESWAAYI